MQSDQPEQQLLMTHLSKREIETLHLLANGYLNKEIAGCLGISVDTVKKHVKSIYKKIQVRNRTEAVYWYLENKSKYPFSENQHLKRIQYEQEELKHQKKAS